MKKTKLKNRKKKSIAARRKSIRKDILKNGTLAEKSAIFSKREKKESKKNNKPKISKEGAVILKANGEFEKVIKDKKFKKKEIKKQEKEVLCIVE